MDISIAYGGASLHLVASEKSDSKMWLDRGFLAPKLILFSNNAYLNLIYMTIPFSNTSGDTKVNYNFLCSQCQLRKEAALGKFLRMTTPKGVTVMKCIAMVIALASWQNCCIDDGDDCPQLPLQQMNKISLQMG